MPDSLNAVTIIALIMAPGYLTLWVARQRISHATPWADVELIIATIAMGILIQAALFPWLGRHVVNDWQDHDLANYWTLSVWLLLSLLVVPTCLGIGIAWIIAKDDPSLRHFGLDRLTRTPRAWQIALGRQQGCFVRVHLTEPAGKVVVGRMSTLSRGSTDPNYADLYLEEVWWADEDDYPIEANPVSLGVWFSPGSIARIEFMKGAE